MDYTLHASATPPVTQELEDDLWAFSRDAVDLPEHFDSDDIFSGHPPPRPRAPSKRPSLLGGAFSGRPQPRAHNVGRDAQKAAAAWEDRMLGAERPQPNAGKGGRGAQAAAAPPQPKGKPKPSAASEVKPQAKPKAKAKAKPKRGEPPTGNVAMKSSPVSGKTKAEL